MFSAVFQVFRGNMIFGILPESAAVLLTGIFFVMLVFVIRKSVKKAAQTHRTELEKTIS